MRPFTGSAVYTIMRNIVEGVFEPPSRTRPEIPRDLEAAVLRAMSRVPGDRFARVRDFGLALVPFMSAQGRQQWSHHFTAPEAEMPIAPSLVVSVHPGANGRPIPTEIAPAEQPVPAPTRILPHDQPTPWHAVPTPTTPTASDVSELAPATPETRRRVVVLATAVVALLVLAAWLLWRPAVPNAERPSSSAAPAVESTPPPAMPVVPVVPAATIPEPSPTLAAPSRVARNKISSKIGKPREVGEPSDRTKSGPKPGADHAPRTGKW